MDEQALFASFLYITTIINAVALMIACGVCGGGDRLDIGGCM